MNWKRLEEEICHLLDAMKTFEKRLAGYVDQVPPERRPSVRNLLHYLSLRNHDVRKLQLELADLGLSSLGRSEGYVMGNLEAILRRLQDALGQAPKELPTSTAMSWHESEKILHRNTQNLFGPKPPHRHVYIMVTAPEACSLPDGWLDETLKAGMNILRINAAHESLEGIKNLTARARKKSLEHQKALKILVDIPGPKLRTKAPHPGTTVLKLRPKRNLLGQVTEPAQVFIHTDNSTYFQDSSLQKVLASESPKPLKTGLTITLLDARGKRRSILIQKQLQKSPAIFLGKAVKTIYLLSRTKVLCTGKGLKEWESSITHDHVIPWSAAIPIQGHFSVVCDPLDADSDESLTPTPSTKKFLKTTSKSTEPWVYVPQVILYCLRHGDRVMFDDGKMVTEVTEISQGKARLKVKQASKGFGRLRGEMGINLPDKELDIGALSTTDRSLIRGIIDQIDLIGLSFVRSASDIKSYREAVGESKVPFIIKVETKSGFRHLPEIMLEALADRHIAVMIARGDLAVECGFERLAEVQEEILWFCEAAHVPVVWATQVLETLAKTGIPTRAEITDAAMSVRAECVMLNKGPFIIDAIESLDSILMRMEAHQYKKRQLYRPLKISLPEDLPAVSTENQNVLH